MCYKKLHDPKECCAVAGISWDRAIWIIVRVNIHNDVSQLHILVDKLITNGVPAHIVRWLAAFLLDRQQQVKIGNIYSRTGSPNGGVPQGTLSGPKCFFYYI